MRKKQSGLPPVNLKHSLLMFVLAIFLLLILHYLVPDKGVKMALGESEIPRIGIIPSDARNLMYKLVMCESGGLKTVINHDDGAIGSHSYGLFQWKISSFKHYNDIYRIVDVEDGEIMNVIFDPFVQWHLTYKVLQEKGGWMNWYTCARFVGLDKIVL